MHEIPPPPAKAKAKAEEEVVVGPKAEEPIPIDIELSGKSPSPEKRAASSVIDHDAEKSTISATNEMPTPNKLQAATTGPGETTEQFGGSQIAGCLELRDHPHDDTSAADAAATRGGQPVTEPAEGFLGEDKQEPKKRKLEQDDAQGDDCAGVVEREIDAINSSHRNANDSPAAKREKSNDAQKCGSPEKVASEDSPQTVSRMCPKCFEVIHFRSERSLVGGFKMHVTRCSKRPKKESSVPASDVISCQKPAAKSWATTAAAAAMTNDRNTAAKSGLFSTVKDPTIPAKDLGMMTKRRLLTRPPDPRPCFGCTWCGLQKGKDAADSKETLCPICKSLEEKGWFRWVQERAAKIIFIDENQKKYLSVRAFLEGSSLIVAERIEHMSPEERSALFAKLHVIGKEDNEIEKKSRPKDIPRPKRDRLAKAKKSPSDSAHAEKGPSAAHMTTTNNERGMTIPALAKFNLPKRGISVAKDVNISKNDHMVLMAKDKVDQLDDDQDGQLTKDCVTSESDDESQKSPEEISIADLAKKEMVSLEKDYIVSSSNKTTMSKRQELVPLPDPRPAWGCEWCGVAKSVGSKRRKLCPICRLLQEHGWSEKTYSTSQHFISPNQRSLRGVKEFLCGTADIVCKALKKMPREDLSALQAKYDFTPPTAKKSPVTKKSSSTVTKRSSGISRSESRLSKSKSGVSDVSSKSEEEQNEGVGMTMEVPMTIELPTVSQLLEEKKGLSGVLEADVFQVYNSYFGTNANIAARILMSLGKGQLPSSISKETPFLRSSDEIQKLSSSSAVSPFSKENQKEGQTSRFVGVFRLKKTLGNGKDEISFGVTIPQFYVNCEWSSEIERTRNGHILPKVATVNGQPLLLRIGIDDEDVAGKLFSFMYRILYGSDAVSGILTERNPNSKSSTQDDETPASLPLPDPPINIPSTQSVEEADKPNSLPLS